MKCEQISFDSPALPCCLDGYTFVGDIFIPVNESLLVYLFGDGVNIFIIALHHWTVL
jgi:hypothetical protein